MIIAEAIFRSLLSFFIFLIAVNQLNNVDFTNLVAITLSVNYMLIVSYRGSDAFLSTRVYKEKRFLLFEICNQKFFKYLVNCVPVYILSLIYFQFSKSLDLKTLGILTSAFAFSYMGRFRAIELFYHGSHILKRIYLLKITCWTLVFVLKVLAIYLSLENLIPFLIILETSWALLFFPVQRLREKWPDLHSRRILLTAPTISILQGISSKLDFLFLNVFLGPTSAAIYLISIKPFEAWTIWNQASGQRLLVKLRVERSSTQAILNLIKISVIPFMVCFAFSAIYWDLLFVDIRSVDYLLAVVIMFAMMGISVFSRLIMWKKNEIALIYRTVFSAIIFVLALKFFGLVDPMQIFLLLNSVNLFAIIFFGTLTKH